VVIFSGAWGIFTAWEWTTEQDGWKVIGEVLAITWRLIHRNGTYLSISGDTPFARGPLVAIMSLDGELERLD